jgi:hypothetical protein
MLRRRHAALPHLLLRHQLRGLRNFSTRRVACDGSGGRGAGDGLCFVVAATVQSYLHVVKLEKLEEEVELRSFVRSFVLLSAAGVSFSMPEHT